MTASVFSMVRSALVSLTVCVAVAVACSPVAPDEGSTRAETDTVRVEPSLPPSPPPKPLAGKVIVIDPGHQLGNSRFPGEINRLVRAGGFRKPCNTTGTSTSDGYPEATLAWQVSRKLRTRLRSLGAKVVLTRTSNRLDQWGPCVNKRGLRGNARPADLKISIHGDGSLSGGHGFHVIAPADVAPTRDTYRSSKRLARAVRAGLRDRGVPVSTYTAGGEGIVFRSDLATLNLSAMPTVMVELGNMRSPVDVRRMRTARGRSTYAAGLARGARTFLTR